jgi:CheY-like chemotaxis protein
MSLVLFYLLIYFCLPADGTAPIRDIRLQKKAQDANVAMPRKRWKRVYANAWRKIYLPRVSGDFGEDCDASEDASASSGTEIILLVEDSKLRAKVTRDFLASAGYRVLVAAEACEALRVAAEYPGRIHLLMTEVVMPHMNGRELSELLLKERPAMKVLFMSGHTAGVISQNVLLDEDVAFLEKPFTQRGAGTENQATTGATYIRNAGANHGVICPRRQLLVMKIIQYISVPYNPPRPLHLSLSQINILGVIRATISFFNS